MKHKEFVHIIFKYLFLMFLTLKTVGFVYEQVGPLLDDSIEMSLNLEFDEDNLENEGEENSEPSELEYISTNNFNSLRYFQYNTKKTYFFITRNYQEQYLEFTTPPPELLA